MAIVCSPRTSTYVDAQTADACMKIMEPSLECDSAGGQLGLGVRPGRADCRLALPVTFGDIDEHSYYFRRHEPGLQGTDAGARVQWLYSCIRDRHHRFRGSHVLEGKDASNITQGYA